MTLNILLLLTAAIAAAAAAYAFSPLAARIAGWVGAVDLPGPRKVHLTPIPRLGGLAVLAGIGVGIVGVASTWSTQTFTVAPPVGVLLGLIPIVVLSFVDDIRSVSPWVKAGCHAAGAGIAVSFGIVLAPEITILGSKWALGWVASPLSIFWLVGITNAFNIVDGLDGLAAGLALIASLAMTAVFAASGQWDSALIPAALSGALIGFLPYNTHPARMFLGDTGAAAIGFLLGTLALRGGSTTSAGLAAALPIFLMGLPIADTLIAIVRRLVGRLTGGAGRVFDADRNHIHHRLLALGFTHQRAVWLLYGAGLLVAAVALLSVLMSDRHAAAVLSALLLAGAIGVQRLGYDEFAVLRRGMLLRLYRAPVLKFALFSVLVDLSLLTFAAYVAVGLRTDDWALDRFAGTWVELLVWLAPTTLATFKWAGLYRGRWSLAGLDDFLRVCLVNFGVALAVVVVGGWVLRLVAVPVVGIYLFVSSLLFVGARASQRILESAYQRSATQGTPVLVYGPGAAATAAVRYLSSFEGDGVLRPVGFVDDDPAMRARMVGGLVVQGTLDELPAIVLGTGALGIVVAGNVSEEQLQRASRLCESLGIEVFRLYHLEHQTPSRANGTYDTNATQDEPVGIEAVVPHLAAAVSMVQGAKCPKCQVWQLHRSRSKSLWERLRRNYTSRRPHRCSACGWRGWLEPEVLSHPTEALDGSTCRSALDLESLDATGRGRGKA